MAVGYEYTLERQENGWWLVCFPKIPEALTEGEIEDEARTNAIDCLITALEGVYEGRQADSETVRARFGP
jgi:predicted RNase H-like HicB family nuclease